MKLIIFFAIICLMCFQNAFGVFTSEEQSWLTGHPRVISPEDSPQKSLKRAEFDATGNTDVNLFRNFYKWAQENNYGPWSGFIQSQIYANYNHKQEMKQRLKAIGFEDPKFVASFFKWSEKHNSDDIGAWEMSDEYALTSTFITKRIEARSRGYTDDEFGYYWTWYREHINDRRNSITVWQGTPSFSHMRSREDTRAELKDLGYSDNVYFRHCWEWKKNNYGKTIADWENSYDHKLLVYREEKRAQLTAAGYSDKRQFNEFWNWFVTSSVYQDPTNPPTSRPTPSPTVAPTQSPTPDPTFAPTRSPTPDPTFAPTKSPTKNPTPPPTLHPTTEPNNQMVAHIIPSGVRSSWERRSLSTDPNTKAWCRCSSEDSSKGISVCRSGCGSPDQVCTSSYGCNNREKSCNADKCTCLPSSSYVSSNDMTFSQCKHECESIGLLIPFSSSSVRASPGTGCDANKKPIWVETTPS